MFGSSVARIDGSISFGRRQQERATTVRFRYTQISHTLVYIYTGMYYYRHQCLPPPTRSSSIGKRTTRYTRAVPQIELPTLLWLSIYPYRVVLDRNNLHVFHSGISITNRAIYHQDDIKCTLTYHRSNEDEMWGNSRICMCFIPLSQKVCLGFEFILELLLLGVFCLIRILQQQQHTTPKQGAIDDT